MLNSNNPELQLTFKTLVLHAIALNVLNTSKTNYPLDELRMPPPFQNKTDFDHSSISEADRQAIRDWCETLNFEIQ